MTPEQVLAQPARSLSQKQRESYFAKGYLLVENAVPSEWIQRLRSVTAEMVERSRERKKSDACEPARWSHHDPRPCLMPPDWSGGYTSIFALQQEESWDSGELDEKKRNERALAM